jgi:hypothetical protein
MGNSRTNVRSWPGLGHIAVLSCSGYRLGGSLNFIQILRHSLLHKKLGRTATFQTLKLKVVIKRLFELYLDTPDGVAFYRRIHIGRLVHVLDGDAAFLQMLPSHRLKVVQNIGSNAMPMFTFNPVYLPY